MYYIAVHNEDDDFNLNGASAALSGVSDILFLESLTTITEKEKAIFYTYLQVY